MTGRGNPRPAGQSGQPPNRYRKPGKRTTSGDCLRCGAGGGRDPGLPRSAWPSHRAVWDRKGTQPRRFPSGTDSAPNACSVRRTARRQRGRRRSRRRADHNIVRKRVTTSCRRWIGEATCTVPGRGSPTARGHASGKRSTCPGHHFHVQIQWRSHSQLHSYRVLASPASISKRSVAS